MNAISIFDRATSWLMRRRQPITEVMCASYEHMLKS